MWYNRLVKANRLHLVEERENVGFDYNNIDDKVRIETNKPEHQEYNGRTGTVIGLAPYGNENEILVKIDGLENQVEFFYQSELVKI